jgi:hypothetical protein
MERIYTTRRQSIITALAEVLKSIDGTGEFLTNVEGNVEPRLLFWDEVDQFPALHLNAGRESRKYEGAGFKLRFMSVTIRCYVQEENAVDALDALMEDVETVLEENSSLLYKDKRGKAQYTQQISILSIDTDEGVLEPLGIGEISIEVQY